MSLSRARPVILSSNIPHYHHLARALWNGGWLRRYITSIGVGPDRVLPGWLPLRLSRKLEGRRLPAMPGSDVRRIWLPELLQRGLPRLGLAGGPRADWLNNELYDRAASRFVDECEIFHFVSTVGLLSARKAARLGARIICDCRQEHPVFQRRLLEEEQQRAGIRATPGPSPCEDRVLEELSLADHMIAPSSYCASTYAPHAGSKMIVLPYGVDPAHFRRKPGRRDRFRVLFVGSACLRKGVHYLVRAYESLKLAGAELVLAGTVAPEMEGFLRKHSSSFRHLGDIPKVELYGVYSEASVLVLPSIADAYPLVALEALACGLPIIISENTGTKDLITDGKEGFVVPIRDEEAIQDRLLRLYSDSERLAEMSQAASRKSAASGWDVYMDRALQIYENLGGGALEQQCG